ncbi:hypothetical protein Pfo_003087 [Paulownia fortunei]|nr:hypothetical protein Pfo_003087 [Paulownia fortunei]
MQSAKETAANITASAKAGMEKTKATVQEKAEKMTTRDPLQNEMATQKKEERILEAERQKQEAREHNVATGGGTYGHDYTTGGGYSTGTGESHPTAAGYPAEGEVPSDYPQGTTAGVVGSQYPAGTKPGGAGRVGHQDPNAGSGARTGYGPGHTY